MAEYNPSKIIKDGNTYNFRDATKIPLSGSNAISGSLIPATDNSIDIGSSTNNIKMLYTKGITIDAKSIDTDANGDMTFDSHIVDTIEEQGDGYIRYSSGIQICWGYGEYDTYQVVSYAKAFVETASVVASIPVMPVNWQNTSFTMQITTDRTYTCWHAIGRWK